MIPTTFIYGFYWNPRIVTIVIKVASQTWKKHVWKTNSHTNIMCMITLLRGSNLFKVCPTLLELFTTTCLESSIRSSLGPCRWIGVAESHLQTTQEDNQSDSCKNLHFLSLALELVSLAGSCFYTFGQCGAFVYILKRSEQACY